MPFEAFPNACVSTADEAAVKVQYSLKFDSNQHPTVSDPSRALADVICDPE